MATQNSFDDFLKDLDDQNIKYQRLDNSRIRIAGIDSINGSRNPFIISSDLKITNDPFATPEQSSWALIKDDNGVWVAKGVNSMYRDQYFGFKKKEPKYYETISEIIKKHVRQPQSSNTTTSTNAGTSKKTTSYKRIITDEFGNILKEEEISKASPDSIGKTRELSQYKEGDKINYLNLF